MMPVIVVVAVSVAVLLLATALPGRGRDPRGSARRFSHQMGVLQRAHDDAARQDAGPPDEAQTRQG